MELANEKELLRSCTLASRNANVHQLKPEIDEQCKDWAYRLVDLNSTSCAVSWDDKLRTKEDYLLWQEVSNSRCLTQAIWSRCIREVSVSSVFKSEDRWQVFCNIAQHSGYLPPGLQCKA